MKSDTTRPMQLKLFHFGACIHYGHPLSMDKLSIDKKPPGKFWRLFWMRLWYLLTIFA